MRRSPLVRRRDSARASPSGWSTPTSESRKVPTTNSRSDRSDPTTWRSSCSVGDRPSAGHPGSAPPVGRRRPLEQVQDRAEQQVPLGFAVSPAAPGHFDPARPDPAPAGSARRGGPAREPPAPAAAGAAPGDRAPRPRVGTGCRDPRRSDRRARPPLRRRFAWQRPTPTPTCPPRAHRPTARAAGNRIRPACAPRPAFRARCGDPRRWRRRRSQPGLDRDVDPIGRRQPASTAAGRSGPGVEALELELAHGLETETSPGPGQQPDHVVDQDLAALGTCAQSRRFDHRGAEVVVLVDIGLTGRQPDPHRQLDVAVAVAQLDRLVAWPRRRPTRR